MEFERSHDPHEALLRITRSDRMKVALRQHVEEIVAGAAFKGSDRSARFLEFIVERATTGQIHDLKERSIGVELFGRPPSYNTSEDAIVRVTASEVRRRLLRHYGSPGKTPRFRIDLPLRSYVPEIRCLDKSLDDEITLLESAAPLTNTPSNFSLASKTEISYIQNRHNRQLLVVVVLLSVFFCSTWFFVDRFRNNIASQSRVGIKPPLPWSALFISHNSTELIASDPNIAEIRRFTHAPPSVSNYANHIYVPDPTALTPEERSFCDSILLGDKVATTDLQIATDVARIAQTVSGKIGVHGARSIQLTDLETDSNFVLLGSPRTNPWVSLFNDRLDFRFQEDEASHSEVIWNVHPRPSEQQTYAAVTVDRSSKGNTGQSFAIVAFVQNPDHDGQVLILAGQTAEGTAAAGKLVTDIPRITSALRQCSIAPFGSLHHFEILLHLSSVAGFPTTTDILTCHEL